MLLTLHELRLMDKLILPNRVRSKQGTPHGLSPISNGADGDAMRH